MWGLAGLAHAGSGLAALLAGVAVVGRPSRLPASVCDAFTSLWSPGLLSRLGLDTCCSTPRSSRSSSSPSHLHPHCFCTPHPTSNFSNRCVLLPQPGAEEEVAQVDMDADVSPEEVAMMQAMGIPFSFDTTAGKHVRAFRSPCLWCGSCTCGSCSTCGPTSSSHPYA